MSDAPAPRVFGEFVQLVRLGVFNESQEEFAKRIGLPRTRLSSVENGQYAATETTIAKIAAACGMTTIEFLKRGIALLEKERASE